MATLTASAAKPETYTGHRYYMANSPTYAQAYGIYGGTVSRETAESIVGQHGFTLADMSGDLQPERDGTFKLWRIFCELGY